MPEGSSVHLDRIMDLEGKLRAAIGSIPPDPWLKLDLTMPQLKVLLLLKAKGATRVSALARGLGVTLPTMTGILDRLVESDLVLRRDHPRDRRLVLSDLTSKGHILTDDLQQANQIRLRRILAHMPPHDLELLAEAMDKLYQAALQVAKI